MGRWGAKEGLWLQPSRQVRWDLSLAAESSRQRQNRPVVQINFLRLEPQRLICAKDDWHGIGADIFKKWLDLLFQQKTSKIGSCGWKHHFKKKNHFYQIPLNVCRLFRWFRNSGKAFYCRIFHTGTNQVSLLLHCRLHSGPQIPPSCRPPPIEAFSCTWIINVFNVFVFIRSQSLPGALFLESPFQPCSDLFLSIKYPSWNKPLLVLCYLGGNLYSCDHFAVLLFLSFSEQTKK